MLLNSKIDQDYCVGLFPPWWDLDFGCWGFWRLERLERLERLQRLRDGETERRRDGWTEGLAFLLAVVLRSAGFKVSQTSEIGGWWLVGMATSATLANLGT